MKKKQAGQAFILVLILLAIGALLVVPSLRLTGTILSSTQTLTTRTKGLYACEAAQEQVMWMLYHGDLIAELQAMKASLPPESEEEPTMPIPVNVCGTDVACAVTWRAAELNEGVMLATEHTMMPTKTVIPNEVANTYTGTYLYTITLTQESIDNSEGLDRVYDVISDAFAAGDVYVPGSTEWSYTGAEDDWHPFDDPFEEKVVKCQRLRWPNPATYGYADFQPDDAWGADLRHFEPGETKYLRFEIQKEFKKEQGQTIDDIYVVNWVMLKVGDVLTLSGPQAPIKVGDPAGDGFDNNGAYQVDVEVDKDVIPPQETTPVTYTITITYTDDVPEVGVGEIIDYLPVGFIYDPDDERCTTTTVMTTPADADPHISEVDFPVYGSDEIITRQKLLWNSDQLGSAGYKMNQGDSVTLEITVLAKQGISGNYYNEVIVHPNSFPTMGDFDIKDPKMDAIYDETYSWNSGIVIVPAYDSEASAEGVTIDTNLAYEINGIKIISWDVR